MAKRILPKFTDQIKVGLKIGRLTVIAKLPNRGRAAMWECLCDCGKLKEVRQDSIRNGDTRSCGCLQKERASQTQTKHGYTQVSKRHDANPVYTAWVQIKARCLNKNDHAYADYGGRGISVCERWLGNDGFSNFLADMGDKPSPKHSIDRRDNDGNYEPANCYWATKIEQANNKRNNVFLEHDGKRMTVSEWSRTVGISVDVLYQRIRKLGWDIPRVLETPKRSMRLKHA